MIVGFRKDNVLPRNGTISGYISVRVNHPETAAPLAIFACDRLCGHPTTPKLGFEKVVKVECDHRIDSTAATILPDQFADRSE